MGIGESEVIVVSSLLRSVVYPAMSRAGLLSRHARTGDVSVLTYHGVLPHGAVMRLSPTDGTLLSADQFTEELRFLKSRYQLISPEDFHSWLKDRASLPTGAVLLTCDDGLRNVLTDMVPILEAEGARCLFFITGASLQENPESLWYEELYRMLDDAPGDVPLIVNGKARRRDELAGKNLVKCWWGLVQELSAVNVEDREEGLRLLRAKWQLPADWRITEEMHAARRYHLLNRQELQQLVTRGMTVGAHTLSHPFLAKMSPDLAELEICECKARLELFLKQEVWALAYPFGDEGSAGARELKMAEGAGYACAFLNYGGGLLRRTNPRFALPRANVTAGMNIAEFEAHMSGFHDLLQKSVRGDGDGLQRPHRNGV